MLYIAILAVFAPYAFIFCVAFLNATNLVSLNRDSLHIYLKKILLPYLTSCAVSLCLIQLLLGFPSAPNIYEQVNLVITLAGKVILVASAVAIVGFALGLALAAIKDTVSKRKSRK